MFDKRKQAVFENAREQGFVDADEQLEEMAFGQTVFSPFMYLLILPLPLMFLARPHAIIATNKNVKVMKQHTFSTKKVTEVVEDQPVEQAQVTRTGFSIKVGQSPKLYAFIGQQGPMGEIAERAGGGEAPPEAPQIPPVQRPE